MERLKHRITYTRRCRNCNHDETYVMRDTNVNPMTDESAYAVIQSYQKPGRDEFSHCENCQLVTKQEIIAFDF